MVRPVKWRYPYPFCVTPPFGGVGHWEGDGKHWEQSGSGYIQVSGDEWYSLNRTEDEGEDVTIDRPDNFIVGDCDDYEVGEAFMADGFEWEIISLNPNDTITIFNGTEFVEEEVQTLSLQRTEHIPELYDYWDVYIYKFLNWTVTQSEIKREHV